MSKKGSILILSIFVITILMILGVTLFSQSISEQNLTERYLNSTHAFWAADAGVSRAVDELRADFNQCGTSVNVWTGTLASSDSGYEVDMTCSGQDRNITVRGFAPVATRQTQRIIEATIREQIPANFYSNAIYSAGDVDINGDVATITGDVRYADTLDDPHNNINGEITNDPLINPLARLSFGDLLVISTGQGNVYNEDRLDSGEDFPVSFWYSEPTDPDDPTTGTPNVVYVTEDLTLNGNIGNIGGFFVVVGDVITSPDDVQDATINGRGTVDGMIYTRGEFRINGGGGQLNVDGSVWAGELARLNGNAHVAYNQDYMAAVESLSIEADAQVISWREQTNPYPLTP